MAFIVAEWNWADQDGDGKGTIVAEHPWSWTFNTTGSQPWPPGYQTWPAGSLDCTDGGRKGHDNPNAHGEWDKHILVVVANKWYDPSYGAGPHNTVADYEAAIMKTAAAKTGGYVAWIQRLNQNNQVYRFTLAHKDPANAQLVAP